MSSFILYDMDNGTYSSAYLHLPLESMPVSGHSTVDTVVNPALDVGTLLSGGPPVLDPGHINSWPPNTPAYPIELHPSIHGNVPRIRPSHPMQTMIIIDLAPSKSTLRGSECFGPARATSNEDLTHVYLDDVDTTQNWVEKGVSTNVSFDQGHQYLFIDGASDISMPSTFPEISCISAVPQYQGQNASQSRPKQYQKKRKRPTAASPPSSGAPKGLYSCIICGCNRAQRQGLWLHYREKHFPNSCMYCGTFKWGRPYRYRKHLEKEHPEASPEVDLGAAQPMATAL
ncbi:hypothetical protein BC826DRAFT_1103666 [Russula brevipes]|nr:hypothetical protein BC826DRAFT_1103666 [Russula brevipes]